MPASSDEVDLLAHQIVDHLTNGGFGTGVSPLLDRLRAAMATVPFVFGGGWERVKVGQNVHLVNALLDVSSGRIEIGDHAFFGHNVSLLTGTHNVADTKAARQHYPTEGRDICVGSGAWIASNATVIGPCKIGINAVIAAGSVVTANTNVEAGCIYAGVPARKVRTIGLGNNEIRSEPEQKPERGATVERTDHAEHVCVKLANVPGFIMQVHAENDPWISDVIRRDQAYEPVESGVFARLVDEGRDVYDVGANIGWYTLIAARKLEGRGRIHAFEPEATNSALLTRNVAINALANVAVHPVALGKEAGTTKLHLCSTNPGDHRTFASLGDERPSNTIAVERLDAWLDAEAGRRALVKIDTQGFEFDVLLGMGRSLFSRDLVLLMEYWPRGLELRGTLVNDLFDLLRTAGLNPAIVTENDALIRRTSYTALAAAATRSLHPSTSYFVNLMLYRGADVPASVRDLFGEGASALVPDP